MRSIWSFIIALSVVFSVMGHTSAQAEDVLLMLEYCPETKQDQKTFRGSRLYQKFLDQNGIPMTLRYQCIDSKKVISNALHWAPKDGDRILGLIISTHGNPEDSVGVISFSEGEETTGAELSQAVVDGLLSHRKKLDSNFFVHLYACQTGCQLDQQKNFQIEFLEKLRDQLSENSFPVERVSVLAHENNTTSTILHPSRKLFRSKFIAYLAEKKWWKSWQGIFDEIPELSSQEGQIATTVFWLQLFLGQALFWTISTHFDLFDGNPHKPWLAFLFGQIALQNYQKVVEIQIMRDKSVQLTTPVKTSPATSPQAVNTPTSTQSPEAPPPQLEKIHGRFDDLILQYFKVRVFGDSCSAHLSTLSHPTPPAAE